MDLDGHRRQTVLVQGRRVRQGARRADRGLSTEQQVVVVRYDEVDRLAGLVRGTSTDGCRPRRNGLRPTVFQDCLISTLCEGGDVVDGDHSDGNGLRVGQCSPGACMAKVRNRDGARL